MVWDAGLTDWRLRRDNGTINSVGSERYGAMGRNLSLYAETRGSEEFYTEWVVSLSPSAVGVGCVECSGNTSHKFLWQ